MTRVNVLLLVALIVSCIYLVRVSHDARRLFTELDRAQNQERLLDNEHERLKSEKQSQATPLRVEQGARDKLQMRPANPAITRYVTYAQAPSAPASSGPAR